MLENESNQSQEESTVEFDVSAFMSDAPVENSTEESTEESATEELKSEESSTEEVQIEEESSTSDDDWDNPIVDDATSDDVQEEEQTVEDSVVAQELDWANIGEELGMEAASKEDVLAEIEKLKEAANKPVVSDSEQVTKMKSYLDLSDQELVAADLKAEGLEEYDIEESIEAMRNSGQLKKQAAIIRREVKKAIADHIEGVENEKKNSEVRKKEEVKENRLALQKELKGFNEFLGVKVSEKEARELYGYIKEGNFMKEALSTHRNVIEAAYLFANRDKLVKIIKSNAFEEGKAHILDKTTNPSINRTSKPDYKIKSEGFDVSEFMKGLKS
jgi:hypothetical protein